MQKDLEKKKFLFLISFFFIGSINCSVERGSFEPKKVALCIVATGKYTDFAQELIKSAERFFLPKHHVSRTPRPRNIQEVRGMMIIIV
jgi:hypothetical protein